MAVSPVDTQPHDDALNDDDKGKPVSELDEAAIYNRLKNWFKADFAHSQDWRSGARLDFDFVAGDQWSAADKAALLDQKRPAITFNRTLSIIKSVSGIEINGRHETVFLPRGTAPGTIKVNELLTGASQWMADSSDADDEQSEAFQDAIVCGMGWTEPSLEFEEDPDGAYTEDKIDPLEMVWDKSARKKNLQDARRIFRVRKLSLEEARDLAAEFGEEVHDDADLNADWASGIDDGKSEATKPVEERRQRLENSGGEDGERDVYIVHAQWIEKETYYRVALPHDPKPQTLTKEQFNKVYARAQALGVKLSFVKQRRKVYKQALLGGRVLGAVKPGLCKDRFTFQCITAEKHRNKGTWFGLVALMRDPQMWANKWLSQTLHILNTTAKGGIIAETDAFENQRQAQDTYAQPDAITWAAPGAIAKNKIMQKPGTGIPTGYINLLEFAISSIRDVTGINMELLGLRDANQPGVLEAQRKQAAMTILATLFDSLRRFRKNVGRVRLGLIQDYLADGRLIRVLGNDGDAEAVELLKSGTVGNFEVIVDDAPTSPNQKQETWAALQMMLPVFRDMLTPELVLMIMEYSPLPSKLVDGLKKTLQEPNPEADAAKAMQKQAAAAKVSLDQARAEKDRATADQTRLQGILDLIQAQASIPVPPQAQQEAVRRILENEPFAIPPVDTGLPQVPQTPMRGGGALPQLPQLNELGVE